MDTSDPRVSRLFALFYLTMLLACTLATVEIARRDELGRAGADVWDVPPLDVPSHVLQAGIEQERAGAYPSALHLYTLARREALAVRDHAVAADAYRYHALLLARAEPTELADVAFYLTEAMSLDRAHAQGPDAADLLALAVVLEQAGCPEEASTTALQAVSRPDAGASVARLVSRASRAAGTYDDALMQLYRLQAALPYYEATLDRAGQAYIWYQAGYLYWDARLWDLSRVAFDECLGLLGQVPETTWRGVSVRRWADVVAYNVWLSVILAEETVLDPYLPPSLISATDETRYLRLVD